MRFFDTASSSGACTASGNDSKKSSLAIDTMVEEPIFEMIKELDGGCVNHDALVEWDQLRMDLQPLRRQIADFRNYFSRLAKV